MPRWTPESRRRQSQVINQVRPWEKSTGPKTPHGKRQSAKNGNHHGKRPPGTHPRELREQARWWWDFLKLQCQTIRWGIGGVDDTKKTCAMILAIERDLGIPQAETELRLFKALRSVAKL